MIIDDSAATIQDKCKISYVSARRVWNAFMDQCTSLGEVEIIKIVDDIYRGISRRVMNERYGLSIDESILVESELK